MRLPSGLQARPTCCSTSIGMERRILPLSTSISTSSRPRPRRAKKARLLPSGEKARSWPPRWETVRSWTTKYWYSDDQPLVRLRRKVRLRASNSTTSKSPLEVEKAATRSPDGEAAGESSWLLTPGPTRNGRPKSLGSPVSISSGRYCLRSQRRKSLSKSSGLMRKVRSTARPTRAPIVLRISIMKSRKASLPYFSSMKSKTAWPKR